MYKISVKRNNSNIVYIYVDTSLLISTDFRKDFRMRARDRARTKKRRISTVVNNRNIRKTLARKEQTLIYKLGQM